MVVIIGYNAWLNNYVDSIFYGEDLISSYDGKYAYLEFTSPKKWMSKIAIFSCYDESYKNELVKFIDTTYRGGNLFRSSDMEKISWGLDTYDLFFEHKEKGIFCYKYLNEEWIGEMYLDIEKTKEEISKGNNIFCFYGDRTLKELESKDNPAGFEKISCEIDKNSVPPYFLDRLEDKCK